LVYDPASNTCTPTGSMFAARQGPNLTLGSDGKVYVSGSIAPDFDNPAIEAYDEATGKFSIVGLKQAGSCCYSQALVKNKLLLSGGLWNGEVRFSSEIFDPATGQTYGTDSLKVGRFLQKNITTSTGTVVEFGGHNGTPLHQQPEKFTLNLNRYELTRNNEQFEFSECRRFCSCESL
jgi:hypothetical protein